MTNNAAQIPGERRLSGQPEVSATGAGNGLVVAASAFALLLVCTATLREEAER